MEESSTATRKVEIAALGERLLTAENFRRDLTVETRNQRNKVLRRQSTRSSEGRAERLTCLWI